MKTKYRKRTIFIFVFAMVTLLCFLYTPLSYGLSPDEVLVIFNMKEPSAQEIASQYARSRHIPEENLLALSTTTDEVIIRKSYLETIVIPLRSYLAKNGRKDRIQCFALIYGMPLRIKEIGVADTIKPFQKLYPKMNRVKEKTKAYKRQVERKKPQDRDSLWRRFVLYLFKIKRAITSKFRKKRKKKSIPTTVASVDSELSLVLWGNYQLSGWLPNPLFYKYKFISQKGPPVYMVARLDGPTPHHVLTMIERTREAEADGLKGKAYFDARGLTAPDNAHMSGFFLYDRRIKDCAQLLKTTTGLETIIDTNQTLFKKDECPDTAIYCGWYRLGDYVDSFTFNPGAVGYHIASAEATSLRFGNYWCKKMIENNITATFGPVAEPYLAAFPDPVIFFSYLLSGQYTLVEAFFKTKPFSSWMMTLIGDPLYCPRLR